MPYNMYSTVYKLIFLQCSFDYMRIFFLELLTLLHFGSSLVVMLSASNLPNTSLLIGVVLMVFSSREHDRAARNIPRQ